MVELVCMFLGWEVVARLALPVLCYLVFEAFTQSLCCESLAVAWFEQGSGAEWTTKQLAKRGPTGSVVR